MDSKSIMAPATLLKEFLSRRAASRGWGIATNISSVYEYPPAVALNMHALSRVVVPKPVVNCATRLNDNLKATRPLRPSDVRTIAQDHGISLMVLLDAPNFADLWRDDPQYLFSIVFTRHEELQQDLVWRGTWLDRDEVRAMDPHQLLRAAFEVIEVTRAENDDARLIDEMVDVLRPFSRALQAGGY